MKKFLDEDYSTLSSTLQRTLGGRTPKHNTDIHIIQQLFQATSHKPQIQTRATEIINRKAQIDNKVKDKVGEREQKNNLYIKYDYNPFVVIKNQSNKKSKYPVQYFQKQAPINLAYKLKHNYQNQLKQIQQNSLQTLQKFGKLKEYFIHSSQGSIYRLDKRKAMNIKQILQNKQNMLKVDSNQNQINYANLSVQQILTIKQKSFFFHQKNKINIFKLLQNDNECLNSFQKLNIKNFSFNAMCDRITNIKIPIYREISRMGWGIITGTYQGKQFLFNHLNSGELIIHVQQLNFPEIMSLASNRINPQLAQKIINQASNDGNMFSDFESEETNEIAIMPKQTSNFTQNYRNVDIEVNQIQTFKKIAFTEEEAAEIDQFQNDQAKIINTLKYQNQLSLNMIRQQKTHFQLTQKVKNGIQNLIGKGINKDRKKQMTEIDKLVRKNKWNKDKKEFIQLKCLKGLLETKNNFNKARKTIDRQQTNQNLLNSTL